MKSTPDIGSLAQHLVDIASKDDVILGTVESCTGGLIAGAITDIAGSSTVFDRGLVTYSNIAKKRLVNVSDDTLARFGAVSEQTAEAMARGLTQQLKNDHDGGLVVLSVTGIAGPGGGSPQKPVGTVCFGMAMQDENSSLHVATTVQHFRDDGRAAIRSASVQFGLKWMIDAVTNSAI